MGQVIDSKVVEMRFDNGQFEKNAKDSLSTIDRLKQSLNMGGASKGLDAVGKAAGKLDFSKLGSAIGEVGSRFSAMEVVGVTALANITNSVVNAGKRMLESLTIAPISEGFSEYELKMDSVQTIMASTGESIKTVNKYLNDLNAYSDKTIYSFSDMTQNIGKFTNAGVKLKDAVSAIQGISNEAAASGASATEASHAMYNFAQALSTGSVKLVDWKSIEVANMATMEFKQQLLDTAVAMGTVVKKGDDYVTTTKNNQGKVSEAFNATKAFNESLNHQWMTTDVLVQTLSNYSTDVRDMTAAEKEAYEAKLKGIGYTDKQIDSIEKLGIKAFDAAQDVKTFSQLMDTLQEAVGSGWATTFETIFGDKEEAKALWTGVNNIVGGFISEVSNARNEMLAVWKKKGGRDALIDSVRNLYNGLLSVVKPIQEAFADVFPPITGKTLAKLTKQFREFTSTLRMNDVQMLNLHNTFRGVFSVAKLVGQGITGIVKAMAPVVSIAASLADGLLSITGPVGEYVADMVDASSAGEILGKISGIVSEKIGQLAEAVKSAALNLKAFIPDVSGLVSKLSAIRFDASGIKDFISSLGISKKSMRSAGDAASVLGKDTVDVMEILSKVAEVASAAASKLSFVFDTLVEGASVIMDKFLDTVDIGDILKNVAVAGIAGSISTLIESLARFAEMATKPFKEISALLGNLNGLLGSGKGVLDSVKESLEAWQKDLQANRLLKLAAAVGVIAVSIKLLSTIEPDRMRDALAGITTAMMAMAGMMAIISKLDWKGLAVSSTSMLIASGALLVMAAALKAFEFIKMEGIAKGLASMYVVLRMISSMSQKNFDAKKILALTGALAITGNAMIILAAALKIFEFVKPEGAVKGIVSTTVVIAALAKLSQMKLDIKNLYALSGALVIASGCMAVLGVSFLAFNLVSVQSVISGLTVFAAVVGTLSTVSRQSINAKSLFSLSGALVIVSGAMAVLSAAFIAFNLVPFETVASGLAVFAGTLGAMVKLSQVNIDVKKLLSVSVTLMAISASMVVLAASILAFSLVSFETIVRGLTAVVGTLASMALISKASINVPKLIALSGALLLISAGIAAIGFAFNTFNLVGLKGVASGLAVLAGTIVMLAALSKLKFNLTETYSMTLALTALGLSLDTMVPAMTALSKLPVAGIVAALGAIAGLFVVFGGATKLLTPLIPSMYALSGALLALSGAILKLGAAIALVGIGVAAFALALKELSKVSASDMETACQNMRLALQSVIMLIPDILVALVEGIGRTVEEIANQAPAFGHAITAIVDMALDVLISEIPKIATAGIEMAVALFTSIRDKSGELTETGADAIVAFVGGIASQAGKVIEAGMKLVLSLMGGIADALKTHKTDLAETVELLVRELTGAFALAMEGTLKGIGLGIGDMIDAILENATEALPKIGEKLSGFAETAKPFLMEMAGIDPKVMEGVKNLAEAIGILTAVGIAENAPIISFFTGSSDFSKIARQLRIFVDGMHGIGDGVSEKDLEGIKTVSKAVKAIAAAAGEIPKSGGLAGFVFGENDLDQFGKMAVYVSALFAKLGSLDGIKNVNDELLSRIKMVAKAVRVMSEVSAEIPNSGGFAGAIFGENDLDVFGYTIKSAVRSVASITSLPGFEKLNKDSVSKIKKASEAVKVMTEAASMLPKSGGVAGFFVGGTKGLDDFADDMVAAAEAVQKMLRGGLDRTQMGDISKITHVAGAVRQMAEAAKTVSDVRMDYNGSNSAGLMRFVDDLTRMAPSIDTFANIGAHINTGSIDNIYKAVVSINRIAETAGTGADLKQYGENLDAFAKSTKKFSDSMAQVDAKSLTAKVKAITKLSQSVKSADSAPLKGFLDNVKNLATSGTEGVGKAAASTLEGALKAINGKSGDFKMAGSKLIGAMAEGMSSKKGEVSKVGASVAKAAKDSVSKMGSSFRSSGANAAQGFVDGMRSKLSSAAMAGAELAKKAKQAVDSTLDIHSPSRVMEKSGKNTSEGFAKGIKKNAKHAETEAEKTARAAEKAAGAGKDGFKKAGKAALSAYIKGLGDKQKAIAKAKEAFSHVTKVVSAMGGKAKQAFEIAPGAFTSYIKVFEPVTKYAANAVKDFNKAFGSKNGAKLIDQYTMRLYKQSDSYKQSKKALAGYTKEVEKLQKKLAKAKKSKDAESIQKEIIAAQKNIAKEAKQMAKDAKKAYTEWRNSIKDSVSGAFDIFNHFEKGEAQSTTTLLENMASQVKGVKEWGSNLQKLAKRGISEGLLKELSDMGIQGAATVEQFTKMTDKQLEKANKLFAKKGSITDKVTDQIVSSFAYAGRQAGDAFTKALDKALDGKKTKTQKKKNLPKFQSKGTAKASSKKSLPGYQSKGTAKASSKKSLPGYQSKGTGKVTSKAVAKTQQTVYSASELLAQLDRKSDETEKKYLRMADVSGKAIRTISSEIGVSKEALKKFVKVYEEVGSAKPLKAATVAIKKFGKGLIADTDEYKALIEERTSLKTILKDPKLDKDEAKDIRARIKEINQQIADDAAKAFQDMYDTVKGTLGAAIDLYSEYEKKESLSFDKILKSTKERNDFNEEWAKNIRYMGSQGYELDFIQELVKEGPQDLSAFLGRTKAEIEEFNHEYRRNAKDADKITSDLMVSVANAANGMADAWGEVSVTIPVKVEAVYTYEDFQNDFEKEQKKRAKEFGAGAIKEYQQAYKPASFDAASNALKNLAGWLMRDDEEVKELSREFTALQEKINKSSFTDEEELKKANDRLEEIVDTIGEKAADAFNSLHDSIRDAAKDAVGIFSATLDAGIDLFSKKTIETLKEDAEKVVDIFSATAKTTVNILNKFSKGSRVSARSLLKIMQGQTSGVKKWQELLDELAKTDISEGLLEQVKEMGTEGTGYIKALLKMTPEQIAEANQAFEEQGKMNAQLYVDAMKREISKNEALTAELDSLLEKGLSRDIYEDLKEQGQSAADTIHGLAQMAAEEIAEVNSLYTKSQKGGKSASQAILENMQSQADAFDEWQEVMKSLASKGISEGLLDTLREMGPEGATQAKAFVEMTAEEISKANELYQKQMQANKQMLLSSSKQNVEDLKSWAEEIRKLAQRGLNDNLLAELAEKGVEGKEMVEAISQMTDAEFTELNKLYGEVSSLPEQVADKVTADLSAKLTPQNFLFIGSAVADGISQSAGTAITAAGTMAQSTDKAVTSILNKDEAAAAGKAVVDGVTQGITGSQEAAVSNAKSVARQIGLAISYTLEEASEQMPRCGRYLMLGIAEGIDSGKVNVLEMVGRTADSIVKELKRKLGIHSPSKVTAEMGRYMDEGLAKGLFAFAYVVRHASEQTAEDAVDAMQGSLSDISVAGDFAPTITPQLDLSQFEREAGRLGQMLDTQQTVRLEAAKTRNVDVVQAIRQMKSDFGMQIGQLSDAIQKMQIVMDTGTLVGAIARPLDGEIGRRVSYTRRGMMG